MYLLLKRTQLWHSHKSSIIRQMPLLERGAAGALRTVSDTMADEGIMDTYWVPALPLLFVFAFSVMAYCYAAQGDLAPKPLKIKELY